MPPEGVLGFHAADFPPSPLQSNRLLAIVHNRNEAGADPRQGRDAKLLFIAAAVAILPRRAGRTGSPRPTGVGNSVVARAT